MRNITLPPLLSYKVRKIAAEKNLPVSNAISFLVEKVCTPHKNFALEGVYTSRRTSTKKGGAK